MGIYKDIKYGTTIDTTSIIDGSIETADIKDASITNIKIVDSTIGLGKLNTTGIADDKFLRGDGTWANAGVSPKVAVGGVGRTWNASGSDGPSRNRAQGSTTLSLSGVAGQTAVLVVWVNYTSANGAAWRHEFGFNGSALNSENIFASFVTNNGVLNNSSYTSTITLDNTGTINGFERIVSIGGGSTGRAAGMIDLPMYLWIF